MDEPKWLTIAKKELGVHEIPGPKATERIIEYDKCTTLKATSDEVPWCAAFVCWCLEQAGVKSTKSAAAVSYADWGHEVEYADALPGDVVVFEWDSGGHHVGFFLDQDSARVLILGGNQHDSVNKTWFSKDDVINVRRA